MNLKNVLAVYLLGLLTLGEAGCAKKKDLDQVVADSHFTVISDTNRSYCSIEQGSGVAKAVKAIQGKENDFVIHVGDMIAGGKKCSNVKEMWEAYDAAIRAPLAKVGIPVFPVEGNHDTELTEEQASYTQYWNQHKPSVDYIDDAHFPNEYSFEHEGIRFIVLGYPGSGDTDKFVMLHYQQIKWLKEQVCDASKKNKKSIIFSHIPPTKVTHYNSDKDYYWFKDSPEEAFDFLAQHGAKLIFAGHHQAYYAGKMRDLIVVTTGGLSDIHTWYLPGECGKRDHKKPLCKPPQTFVRVGIQGGEVQKISALHGGTFDEVYDNTLLPRRVGQLSRSLEYQ